MEIDRILEKEFVRILQIKRYERTGRENYTLKKRNRIIGSQFELNDEIYKKIERLNEMLLNEEKRIFIEYRALEANAKLMVEKGLIDDYEMHIETFCCNKSYYQDIDPELGDAFYETSNSFMIYQEKEFYEPRDFTERSFLGDTPMTKYDHCYSFHQLCHHTDDLAWFDICNIDGIWMELKVNYQFFFENR